MAYQFVRKPLRTEDADRLCHACKTLEEKLVIFTLLDTGLRVSELCNLTPQNILWQEESFTDFRQRGPSWKKVKEKSCAHV